MYPIIRGVAMNRIPAQIAAPGGVVPPVHPLVPRHETEQVVVFSQNSPAAFQLAVRDRVFVAERALGRAGWVRVG